MTRAMSAAAGDVAGPWSEFVGVREHGGIVCSDARKACGGCGSREPAAGRAPGGGNSQTCDGTDGVIGGWPSYRAVEAVGCKLGSSAAQVNGGLAGRR